MADNKKQVNVKETAQSAIRESKAKSSQGRQFLLWFGALILGGILGWLGIQPLNEFFNFVATVFTRLFQFIAVPTIALAVITTLAALGNNKDTSRIFSHALFYTSPQSVQQLRVFVFIYGFLQEIFLWILSMPVKKLYLCKN